MSQLFQIEYPIVNIFIMDFRYSDLGESHSQPQKGGANFCGSHVAEDYYN